MISRIFFAFVFVFVFVLGCNSIRGADLDGDGDLYYLVGNLGLNYKYQASDDNPFEIYGGDFDNNGIKDIVLGYYSDEELYPVRGLQCSSEQIPDLKVKFPSYEKFGKSNLREIYGSALEKALHYKANHFSSSILWNEGDKFTVEPLPLQAQFFPIQDCVFSDIDNDQDLDIIIAGNWFVAEIETSRADSGTGLILLN